MTKRLSEEEKAQRKAARAAKKEEDIEVSSTARIVRLIIGVKATQVMLEDFSPDLKAVNQMTRWIESDTPVVVKFQDISVATKISKMTVQG